MTKPSRPRSWRWLAPLGAIAIALALALLMIWPSARSATRGFVAELAVDLFGHTEYARGYGEAAFAAVAQGTDESAVLATLGAPLATRTLEAGTRWLYANDDAPEFARTGEVAGPLSYTVLEFDRSGTFVGASGQLGKGGLGSSQIDLDPEARLGRNHLGLDGTAIDRLRERRATRSDLEQRFGKPRAAWTSTAVRELFYSRSPTSTHFHVRSVGIDDAGKVCWTRRGVYWD